MKKLEVFEKNIPSDNLSYEDCLFIGFNGQKKVNLSNDDALLHILIIGKNSDQLLNSFFSQKLTLGGTIVHEAKSEKSYEFFNQLAYKSNCSAMVGLGDLVNIENKIFYQKENLINYYDDFWYENNQSSFMSFFEKLISEFNVGEAFSSLKNREKWHYTLMSTTNFNYPFLYSKARAAGVSLIITLDSIAEKKSSNDVGLKILFGNTYTKLFYGEQSEKDISNLFDAGLIDESDVIALTKLTDSECYILSPKLKKIINTNINNKKSSIFHFKSLITGLKNKFKSKKIFN